jgi:hypothetical protein
VGLAHNSWIMQSGDMLVNHVYTVPLAKELVGRQPCF